MKEKFDLITLRKNGKYYQIGFNYKKKWHNILHLGTPKEILRMLRIHIKEEYQILLSKMYQEKAK